jgi:hypothetical protein
VSETEREDGCCLLVAPNRRWSKTARDGWSKTARDGDGAKQPGWRGSKASTGAGRSGEREAADWHQADDEELKLERRSTNNEKKREDD